MIKNVRFFAAVAVVILTLQCGASHKEFARRINSGDVSVRVAAAKELRGQPRRSKLVPIILQACRDENVDVRMHAFYAIGRVDPREEGVVAAVLVGVSDTSVEVRRAVTASMGTFDPFPNTCVPYLVRLLVDPDEKVRTLAFSALSDLREGGAVGALMRGMDSKDADMRLAVINVLAQIGSSAKLALPKLKRAAQDDEDEKVQEAARKAIEYIER